MHSSSISAGDPEKQQQDKAPENQSESANEVNLTVVVCNGDSSQSHELAQISVPAESEESSELVCFSSNASSHEQCRVCLQEKQEALIDLGCRCRGGLAKAHRSCIEAWFLTKGSNRCEICQVLAVNVPPPETRPGCFSPRWVAFSILIFGFMLDVLIIVPLGVTALPVGILIGVIVVLGLGTAVRLGLEFLYDWCLRRAVHRA
ncbi:unnamed protein product [Microthlaspi erraticum]|uniref:RING-CH-type domain-containing protein n=1 Tax=Microthlaspi erraticum TaxID=1685480 RepID=A0A6D2KUH9_9BRAS|nr:unnamed protein product [Microthlaspi erraticum]